jgi:transmembrane sensor
MRRRRMTTMADDPSAERTEEEASLWAARIEGGSLTARDRAELSAWLAADPGHRRVLASYCELSALLDARLSPADVPVGAVVRRRWRVAVGALMAAAAAVAFIAVLAGRPRSLATKTAERQAIALDDGSRVELNARTSLFVDFRRDERRVRLASGEAWFSVAKMPSRPFVVETLAGVVRVTGTEFNVRATRDDRAEVTVLAGTVHVRAAGAAASDEAVTPGRQALVGGGRVIVHPLPEGAAQDVVAWRRGQTVFDDTPLGEAVERFAAYHARTIAVDPAVADLRLGGRYSLEDLDGLLESVESVLPVRVLRGPDGEVRIAPAARPGR